MTIFLTTTTGDVTINPPAGEDGTLQINVSNPELDAIVKDQRRQIEELKSQLADANAKLVSRGAKSA